MRKGTDARWRRLRPVLRALPLAAALGAALGAALPSAASAQSGRAFPLSGREAPLSTHGLPGLISTPAAATQPAGTVQLHFNTARDAFVRPDVPPGDRQYNAQVGISLLDRVIVAARGSEVPPPAAGCNGCPFILRDLSANVQLLLLREREWLPAVAVGAHDLGGGDEVVHFRSRHLVASKSFLGRVRVSGGYGTGDAFLGGAFGGLEVSPFRGVTLLAEHDGNQVNAGLRTRPFADALRERGLPLPNLDLYWKEEEGYSVGVALSHVLGRDEPDGAAPVRGRTELPREERDAAAPLSALADRLVDLGLENVRVERAGAGSGPAGTEGAGASASTLVVAYENRTYSRNELDALGRVLETAASLAPDGVERLRVRTLEAGVPVLEVEVERAVLESYLDGEIGGGELARGLRAGFPAAGAGGPQGPDGPEGPAINPSFRRFDLFLRPEVLALTFWDFGVFNVRVLLRPELEVQLFRGTTLDVGAAVPLFETGLYRRLAGPLPDPGFDHAVLRHLRRLPSPVEGSGLFAQWSGGVFSEDFAGLRQELALFLAGGRLRLGADVALIAKEEVKLRGVGDGQGGVRFEEFREWGGIELDNTMAVADARLLIPELDLHIGGSAGRYLDGDYGVTGQVSRFFGDVELGFFLTHTERGSHAGARIELPLGPERSRSPRRFRVRLPSDYSFTQRTTIFTDLNEIRSDIARRLPGRYDLSHDHFDRDRFVPAAVPTGHGRDRPRRSS